jgi:two-component system chemotaxis sensor kinase CheA
MQFGLAVDDVVGAEEIVVKPLGAHFQKLDIFAGCSILGDGGVVPIIDCNGLMQKANLSEAADLAISKGDHTAQERPKRNLQHIVLFEYGGERYAIPMSIVQRLETIPRNKVEKTGGTEVLQYRGDVIPFRRWQHLLRLTSPADENVEEDMACVILSDGEGHLCLEVGQIIDVAEVPLDVELGSSHSIFLGTAVIFEQATEIVDVYELVKAVAPEWFGKAEGKAGDDADGGKPSLLLLEGSAFFRDLLLPTLESMGYAVWTADSTLHAKAWLDQFTPRMIVADLDMPDQQGMDLTRWVKEHERLGTTPVVALASFQPRRDEDKELFTASLLKTDSTSLRVRIQEIMSLDVATA